MTTVLQDYVRLGSNFSPADSCVGELLAELVSLWEPYLSIRWRNSFLWQ